MKSIFSSKIQKITIGSLVILILCLSYMLFSDFSLDQVKFLGHKKLQTEGFPELSQIPSNGDLRSVGDFFEDLANKNGGEYAYHALAYAARQGLLPPNVDTHLLGHRVGDTLYKQMGVEGIKVCTDDLRNACSHSIVVGSLLDNGLQMLPKIVQLCKQAPGGKGAYSMCVHGLGHGVLAFFEYDFKQAVTTCQTIGTSEYNNVEVAECIGGATMEMMAGVHDHDAWVKQASNYIFPDDPLSPCDASYMPDSGKSNCYTYLTPNLFKAAGADLSFPDPKYYAKAMSYCSEVPELSYRSTCYGAFGKEFVGLVNARNIQTIESMSSEKLGTIYDWCNKGPQEALAPCLNSALRSLYWGGENEYGVSVRFCSAIPETIESNKCYASLIDLVAFYINDPAYKQSFCQSLPAEQSSKCKIVLIDKT